jgi:hypothetical protein
MNNQCFKKIFWVVMIGEGDRAGENPGNEDLAILKQVQDGRIREIQIIWF